MRILQLIGPAAILLVTACGGESSSSSSTSGPAIPEPPETENVALAANGGSATASYDNDSAGLVINGNTDTGEFWAGNAQGDFVTVAFDDTYKVTEFTIYTNNTSSSTVVETSSNGTDFDELVLVTQCASFSLGSGQVFCRLSGEITASHFRVVIDADSNISARQIYEIEVEGYKD